MVQPVLDFLLKKNYKVTFITSRPCLEIFDGIKHDNLKIVTKTPYLKHFLRKTFSKIIRLKYEKYPQLSCQDAYAKILKLDNFKPRKPQLKFRESTLLERLNKPYVVVHTETASELNYRKIYAVEWEKVSDYIMGQNYSYYQIEKNALKNEQGEEISPLSINDLKAVIANSSLFIGNDSFPSHLAVAFNIPSIIFFGAINPNLRHPDLSNVTVMQNDCEFSGCYHNPKYFQKKGLLLYTVCPIVGSEGVPPCCVHSSNKVINEVKKILG